MPLQKHTILRIVASMYVYTFVHGAGKIHVHMCILNYRKFWCGVIRIQLIIWYGTFIDKLPELPWRKEEQACLNVTMSYCLTAWIVRGPE